MKARFSQNAATYDKAARVQKEAAQILLEKIYKTSSHFNRACDLGSGTGLIPELLLNNNDSLEIDCCDISKEMLIALKQKLPQANIKTVLSSDPPQQNYDLIISNFSLQWYPSIPETVSRCLERLSPQGTLALSIPISGTFDHLQKAIEEIKVNVSIPSLPSKEFITNCFSQLSGVSFEVIDLYDYFPNTLEFLKGLHKIGATREGVYTSRTELCQLIKYHDKIFEGPIAAKYKILQLIYKR